MPAAGSLSRITQAPAARLFLLGFLTLFAELALIRYLAGTVWNLGYFPNLVLLAVFVGMGLGFLGHHRLGATASDRAFRASTWVLFALLALVALVRPSVPGFAAFEGEVAGELYFTATPADDDGSGSLAVLGVCFVGIVVVFGLISQRTAKLFARFSPLRAYTLDIGGSCAGIVAFTILSALGSFATIWFLVIALAFVLAAPGGGPRWARMLPAIPLVGMVAFVARQDLTPLAPAEGDIEIAWSPYQRVELVRDGEPHRTLFVNGIVHQRPETPAELQRSHYGAIHRLRADRGEPPFRRVLVLGAGTGNDVAAALLHGAEHVDAVEIDPRIADFGRSSHPARPYLDERVTLIVDDGRAFMQRTSARYDLVVFALTDSLVKVSPMAQLRLENYLFTVESVAQAWTLLEDGGELVFYNHYRQPWLAERIRDMATAATGVEAQELQRSGDLSVIAVSQSGPAAAAEPSRDHLPTDDWPFLYLRERGIPREYAVALIGVGALVLALALVIGRRRADERDEATGWPLRGAFLLMGIAFLLLETKSVIQFSLLFGTTWLNNSLVFLAVLASVLAANWIAAAWARPRLVPVVVLLLSSCVAGYFIPLGELLTIESTSVRFGLASLLTFSPIFFANLLFSISLRDAALPERLFGYNLVGTTLGALLEYTSMATGYTALALLVAVLYVLVFVALLLGRSAHLPVRAQRGA